MIKGECAIFNFYFSSIKTASSTSLIFASEKMLASCRWKAKPLRKGCLFSFTLWSQQGEVQPESLTSIGVVNQVAKLHYLQQHDNPFNTWHTPVTSVSPTSSMLTCYIWLSLLTNFSRDVNLITHTHTPLNQPPMPAGRGRCRCLCLYECKSLSIDRKKTHAQTLMYTNTITRQGEKLQWGKWPGGLTAE